MNKAEHIFYDGQIAVRRAATRQSKTPTAPSAVPSVYFYFDTYKGFAGRFLFARIIPQSIQYPHANDWEMYDSDSSTITPFEDRQDNQGNQKEKEYRSD